METGKFKEYLLVINELLEKEILIIEWYKTRLRIKTRKEIDQIIKDRGLDNKKFFSNVEYSANILRRLAIGELETKNEKDIEKYNLVQEILFNEKIKDEINIKLTSNLVTIQEIEAQILTKRSKENPKNIITHTIALDFLSKTDIENDLESIITMEVSAEQLRELVENLSDSLDQLEQLKEEQMWQQQLELID